MIHKPTSGKPTIAELGIDVEDQAWQRSGNEAGALEVAFVDALGHRWVLLRVTEDPEDRILVYNAHEWDCFLDGARNKEFNDALPDAAVPLTGGFTPEMSLSSMQE